MARKNRVSVEDSELFRQSVGNISRIEDRRIIHRKKSGTRPLPRTEPEKPRIASVNSPSPVGISDQLSFKRSGIQQRLLDKLKKGQLPIERELDLHGMTRREAVLSLQRFLNTCNHSGIRAIRIIHGKGHGSENNYPVIKNMLNQKLRDEPLILAFCSARNNDGGAGVLYAWLKNRD